ncbi:MAG: leucine-rich repeat protein, partial [Oscillospiraceae bacterium]|nr:leucine-rich repeat protein [Oscillospiraceae bacterium]
IKKIIIEEGVTSIGNGAFSGCSSLVSATIPDSVTGIGRGSFDSCSSLVELTIPNNLKGIGLRAFADCSSLTSVTIPNSVTDIGGAAFAGCSSLTSISIGSGVTSIISSAFNSCPSLVSMSVSPDNKRYHSEDNCLIETEAKNLIWGGKNSVIPSDGSVTKIFQGAFYGCSSLTSVNIPDSVTIIDCDAFFGCSSLASVNIPKSVKKIENGAFYGCEKLTEVYYTGSKTDWNNIKISEKNDDLTKAKIYFNTIIYKAKVIERSGTIYSASNIIASDIIKAAGTGTKILKVDGTKLKSTEKVGSGMTLVKSNGTKLTIIVKGDNDGDGEINASDARFALRTAVSLEKPNNWQKNASLVDSSKTGITAADARLILRAAVNLEKLNLY